MELLRTTLEPLYAALAELAEDVDYLRLKVGTVANSDCSKESIGSIAFRVSLLAESANPWTYKSISSFDDVLGTGTVESEPYYYVDVNTSTGARTVVSQNSTTLEHFTLDSSFRMPISKRVLTVPVYVTWKNTTHANAAVTFGHVYDMSGATSDTIELRYSCNPWPYNKNTGSPCVFGQPTVRLLLPPNCICSSRTLYSTGILKYGLYLNKTGTCAVDWICVSKAGVGTVKNPPESDCNYYLNMIPDITAEDMVGIFENMIDRSTQTKTKYITLGSDNLAKLTEEQKNIAYAKGWSLQ